MIIKYVTAVTFLNISLGDLVLMMKQHDSLEAELTSAAQCVLITLLCTWHIVNTQEAITK